RTDPLVEVTDKEILGLIKPLAEREGQDGRLAEMLQFVGLNTVEEVSAALKQNHGMVVRLAKASIDPNMAAKTAQSFTKGLSVAWLTNLLALQKGEEFHSQYSQTKYAATVARGRAQSQWRTWQAINSP